MKLINSKVELIPQFDLFKHIELAGRTCYKSEDKITDDSASAFVGRIINSKHLSVLEHGTVYLTYHLDKEETGDFDPYKYIHNPYSRVNIVNNEDGSNDFYITTNYRVIVENNWEADMHYQTEPSSKHIARYTFRFTCSRAIANEIVRHRVMSFSQESQRYCNYNKDKFGNTITYIIPEQFNKLPMGDYIYWDGDWCDAVNTKVLVDHTNPDFEPISAYLSALDTCEMMYFKLIKQGVKPQVARDVLPNATKTEIVVTGFESDWDHFLALRDNPAAHPDIQKLAKSVRKLLNK